MDAFSPASVPRSSESEKNSPPMGGARCVSRRERQENREKQAAAAFFPGFSRILALFWIAFFGKVT
jgi:hypothetical protein